MLEVLGVLGDQVVGELAESDAKLGDDLGANEVLYGLLGSGIGVVLNLKLGSDRKFRVSWGRILDFGFLIDTAALGTGVVDGLVQGNIRRTHLPRYRGLPRGW